MNQVMTCAKGHSKHFLDNTFFPFHEDYSFGIFICFTKIVVLCIQYKFIASFSILSILIKKNYYIQFFLSYVLKDGYFGYCNFILKMYEMKTLKLQF